MMGSRCEGDHLKSPQRTFMRLSLSLASIQSRVKLLVSVAFPQLNMVIPPDQSLKVECVWRKVQLALPVVHTDTRYGGRMNAPPPTRRRPPFVCTSF